MAGSSKDNLAPEFGDNFVPPEVTAVDAQLAQMLAFGISEDEAKLMVDD